MTHPNSDSWVRDFLEHVGVDPDEDKPDPHIPDNWYELPGFLFTQRIDDSDNVDAELARYDEGSQRAEYRTVDFQGNTLHYKLVFSRESDETS